MGDYDRLMGLGGRLVFLLALRGKAAHDSYGPHYSSLRWYTAPVCRAILPVLSDTTYNVVSNFRLQASFRRMGFTTLLSSRFVLLVGSARE